MGKDEPMQEPSLWTKVFTDPRYVSYAEILEPKGAQPDDEEPVEVQAVAYQDVLTTADDPDIEGGTTFKAMRIAVGDCVLAYTGDPPHDIPFVARVRGIVIKPRCTWGGINETTGGDPAVTLRNSSRADKLWVENLEAKGWIPAKYFLLKVQYLYRYAELIVNLKTRAGKEEDYKTLEKALAKAGMMPPGTGVGTVTQGRQMERVARFLAYSNHLSSSTDAYNPHVPLASVINTCRVHFLGKKEEHTCLLMEPPNKGAAAGGASASASGEYAGAQASRLQQQRMPGFVCNLYYDQEASPGEKTLYWLPSRELADDLKQLLQQSRSERAKLSGREQGEEDDVASPKAQRGTQPSGAQAPQQHGTRDKQQQTHDREQQQQPPKRQLKQQPKQQDMLQPTQQEKQQPKQEEPEGKQKQQEKQQPKLQNPEGKQQPKVEKGQKQETPKSTGNKGGGTATPKTQQHEVDKQSPAGAAGGTGGKRGGLLHTVLGKFGSGSGRGAGGRGSKEDVEVVEVDDGSPPVKSVKAAAKGGREAAAKGGKEAGGKQQGGSAVKVGNPEQKGNDDGGQHRHKRLKRTGD